MDPAVVYIEKTKPMIYYNVNLNCPCIYVKYSIIAYQGTLN